MEPVAAVWAWLVSAREAQIVLLVVSLTVLFDLLDLYPQIGSWRFVVTITYLLYLTVRCVMATAAATVLQVNTNMEPFLVGVTAVFATVAVLQSFVMKVAGENVVDVGALIEKYKVRMIKGEADRAAQAAVAPIIDLGRRLSGLDSKTLEASLRLALLTTQPAETVATTLEKFAGLAGDNDQFLCQILATQIVILNQPLAERLLLEYTPA